MGGILAARRASDRGCPPRGTQLLLAGSWALYSCYLLISQFEAPSASGVTAVLGWSAVAVALLVDVLIVVLPWGRWDRTAPLWLVPFVFVVVAVNWHTGRQDAFAYALPFMAAFLVIGVTQAPGMALRFAPLMVVTFLLPLLIDSTVGTGIAIVSTTMVVPFCVISGELVARAMARIRWSEAELAATNERYMMAFEAAPVGMTQLSPDGTFLHVNGAYARMMGYEVEALVGRGMNDITHPDDRDALAASVASLLAGEVQNGVLEKRNLRGDGTEVWVKQSASLVRDDAGDPLYMFGHAVDITEERSLRHQLAHAAEHDQLTGLPNRTVFMSHLERMLVRAGTEGDAVALLFIDVDGFKLINDGLGHDVGDQALQSVARSLAVAVRPQDMVARIGGDEFVVVCGGASADIAVHIADRLEAAVRRPLPPPNHAVRLSLSIGVAVTGPDDQDATLLMRQADTAMYRAKAEGQGRIAVYQPGEVLLSDRKLQTVNDLRAGLERGEFELYYQPVVELATERMVCLKAEVRWNHPSQGLLAPSEFMGIAEEADLGADLCNWALREACRQGAEWAVERNREGQGADRLNLAVDVSVRQLMDPEFAEMLGGLLANSPVPSILWLEITEDAVLGSGHIDGTGIDRIRALGVHCSIRGFGTQRSSLSYLKELPVELVTIDETFVEHIEDGAIDAAMIEAMLTLATSMGVLVTAEGVERRSQAELLASMGCMMAQGPLFGTALSVGEIGGFPSDDLSAWRVTAS